MILSVCASVLHGFESNVELRYRCSGTLIRMFGGFGAPAMSWTT